MEELSERDRQVLTFEKQWWRHRGAKDEAARDLFGVSGTRYEQLVNTVIDKPAALVFDPVLVNRLRRVRDERRRTRRMPARPR